VNPLLGGALAAIALSFDRNGSVLDLIVVLGYFVPLHALVSVYLPQQNEVAPDAVTFVRAWEMAPRTTTRRVAYALADSLDKENTGLSATIERKAAKVRRAVWWLYAVTAAVVLTRVIEALVLAYVPVSDTAQVLISPRNNLHAPVVASVAPVSNASRRTLSAPLSPQLTSPAARKR
jgi:hypothetical protein